MRPEETAALAAMRDVLGEEVRYSGAGLSDDPVIAIRSDVPADEFQGPGATARRVSYEIARSALPQRPGKSDLIVDGDDQWRVNDVTERRDVDAWVLTVEKAFAS